MTPKICLACSAGGHLTEMLQIRDAYEKYEHYYVTFKRPNGIELSKKRKVYFVRVPSRNTVEFLINFFQSASIFFKEKPDIVISTGADGAIATCILAKIFGKKVVFIESFCRISTPSLSGRIVYLFADLFLVQWEENLRFFPCAKFMGRVF